MKHLSQYRLILIVSLFFTIFYNYAFFRNVLEIYPFEGINILYVFSTFILLFLVSVFLFSLFASKFTSKLLLISTILISSFTAYFMDTYNIIIDYNMIINTLQTNTNEFFDLLSVKLLLYVFFLGILPAIFVYRTKIDYLPFKKEILQKLKYTLSFLLIIVIVIVSLSKFYASFFREHKSLRFSSNPTYWIYNVGKYINITFLKKNLIFKKIGLDAKIQEDNSESKENRLIILVVGEAARANRFSLNNYSKQTNPLLEKENIVNFSNMYSCGTTTAKSVPCMFSVYDRSNFTYNKGISTENVLDVLKHTTKVNILWRDNNSSSKGVALRVDYEDFKSSKTNTLCEGECRDEGMLIGLDKYIKKHKGTNILIVLHQMGNHGPAYYKRYPKEFEKFTPVCKSNLLEKCTQEEVSNAYDNAILYTDYFLSKVINFLKPYSKQYQTAMIYMSDHGESLGENGLYLHGLPYFIAPDNQKHIASVMWFGKQTIQKNINVKKLKTYAEQEFSQDNLFHTLLGLFRVETKEYKQNKDILYNARKN